MWLKCTKIYLNTFLIFCLHAVWKGVLQKCSCNLRLPRCASLLPSLSRSIQTLENQHMVAYPFIHPAMVSLAAMPLQTNTSREEQQQNNPFLAVAQVVNNSSYFLLFLAYLPSTRAPLVCPSSSQGLSFQLLLQWFFLIWSKSSFSFSKSTLLLIPYSSSAYLVITHF